MKKCNKMEVSNTSFINELINLYKNRERETMNPSPYALYFLKNGREIVLEESKLIGNKKPKSKDVLLRILREWVRLSSEEKKPYIEAAFLLGYVEPPSFIDTSGIKQKIQERKNGLIPNIQSFIF